MAQTLSLTNAAGANILAMIGSAPEQTPAPPQHAKAISNAAAVSTPVNIPSSQAVTSNGAGLHLLSMLGVGREVIEEDTSERIVFRPGGSPVRTQMSYGMAPPGMHSVGLPCHGTQHPAAAQPPPSSHVRLPPKPPATQSDAPARQPFYRGPSSKDRKERVAKGPDGTIGFHKGRADAGLPTVLVGGSSASAPVTIQSSSPPRALSGSPTQGAAGRASPPPSSYGASPPNSHTWRRPNSPSQGNCKSRGGPTNANQQQKHNAAELLHAKNVRRGLSL